MILGITGGTGCGKSTLLSLIAQKGGLVLDCDRIYHELLKTDRALLAAIENRFPGVVERGLLDRKKLGGIVFADSKALEDLNRITHGAVKAEVLRRLQTTDSRLVAIDAYGLHEGGLSELCQLTVAITAPLPQRVARLMARDGISEEYARARINAQKSNAEFSALCDRTLENSGTADDFQRKCLAFLLDIGIM